LFIWLRTGEKVAVKVPKGCFLLQAAKQLEIMTAGHIFAGFHEVIVTEETKAATEKAKREGKSLWRVSSTMFSSIRYDEMLQPLDIFKGTVSENDSRKIITNTLQCSLLNKLLQSSKLVSFWSNVTINLRGHSS
jgi:hypothetical protein